MTQPAVFSERCATCIFRPGNLMHLDEGRLAELVAINLEQGTAPMCHLTTFGQADREVMCRGFYDAYGEYVTAIRVIETVFGGFDEVAPPGTVTVRVENTYACGRESEARVTVPAPEPGAGLDEWWDEHVHDHTGDGHPCGETEHALYEVTIVAAPLDRPELAGETTAWEG